MQNPNVDIKHVDNLVIVVSLMIARHVISTSKPYPEFIRKRLLKRINILIKERSNPNYAG